GGDVRLSAGSRVGDELVMVGGRLLSDPGSYVGSKRSITPKFRVGPEHWHGPHLWPHMWMAWWSSLLSGIIGFFLAWGVLVLLTQSAGDFLSLSRNLWREKKFVSSLSGLGVVLSFLPGLLFLVVTLVGILLVPVYLLAVAALTLVAYALIIDRLGHSFLVQQDLPLWKRVLMGQICWTVLSAVPFVGAIVIVGLWLLGLGVSIQAATRRFLAPA
ncbi:MAG: hypothetical protein KDD43_16645, partial [Bdellovibrionales bacterium]|nr:hypothetical protein [Bdellovibrionales bacterium]